MAVGDITYGKYSSRIKIIDNLTVANAAPAVAPPATATSSPSNTTGIRFDWIQRGNLLIRDMSIVLATRSGSGSISVVGRLYGWLDELGVLVTNAGWCPAGKAAAEADRGKLNDGVAITGTGSLRHAEPWQYVNHLDGLYLELSALAGTTPAFDAWVVIPHERG